MFQEILQTILTSVIARVTANISSLYIAIGATIAVIVCGFFLYKQYFSAKPVEKPKEKAVTFEEPEESPQEPLSREEAFAAAMQAEQESMEQELKKRQALNEPAEHTEAEQSEHME